jgi:Protein of unknown function (DUF1161)
MVKLIVVATSTAVFMLGLSGSASAQGMASTASAQASSSETPMLVRKPCEELRAEIDAKIKKNGVPMFTLDILDMDAQAEGKVVGTCDGNTKKIVYKRG